MKEIATILGIPVVPYTMEEAVEKKLCGHSQRGNHHDGPG